MDTLRTRRSYLFCLSLALAGLLLVTILASWNRPDLVIASGGARYVDGTTGIDSGDCGDPAAPCQTIGYALSQAFGGDTIRVAAGHYFENLVVDLPVNLEGGYVAGSWARNPNPILNETTIDGTSGQFVVGDWDGSGVLKPAVIKDGSQYRMWFDGRNILRETRIGLATSTDGTLWARHPGNPVLGDVDPNWNPLGEHAPFVMYDDGLYKMWFEYTTLQRQLAYATSPDGINWTVDPAYPVLAAGPDGYDQDGAAHGTILKEGGTYKLWYHALGDEGAIIAHATSPDGLSWTKHGPVLRPEGDGWESWALWGPSVLNVGGVYWMWYAAGGTELAAIGVVTSTNGLDWNRFLPTPVISDAFTLGDPQVIFDGGLFKMWYSGWYEDPSNGHVYARIDYAESTDGINWTKFPGNPVLGPGDLGIGGQSAVAFEAGSAGSTLDGFVVRGGHTYHGGGVKIHATDITIRGNVIEDNRAQGDFGGGLLVGGGSSATVSDNVIRNNQTIGGPGGGIMVLDAEAAIERNLVQGNTSYYGGGGIAFYYARGSAVENQILDNDTVSSGGGIQVVDSAESIAIFRNVVHANMAAWGGGIHVLRAAISIDSNDLRNNQVSGPDYLAGGIAIIDPGDNLATVLNNLVVDNANEGLEISNFTSAEVVNNTFAGNGRVGIEVFAWSGFAPEHGLAWLVNNIVAGHTECGVSGFNGAAVVAFNNDVWNNLADWCGDFVDWNNISVDPLFVDAGGGDYHLQAGSPAIDAGTSFMAPGYDLAGNVRPFGHASDIGAYEWPRWRGYLPVVAHSAE